MSTETELIRIGLYLMLDTPASGTVEASAVINPIFVNAGTTVTGVDFNLAPMGGGPGGPSAEFSGTIEAGTFEFGPSDTCEVVLWDWAGVDSGSGIPELSALAYVLSAEPVDCPEPGGAVDYSMLMGLTGPDGLASQVGMFATIWGSGGVEAVGSPSNPITVDGSASYMGIDFDLSHHPGGSDEGSPGEPGQLTYIITMPEGESGSIVVGAYAPSGDAVLAGHCSMGFSGSVMTGTLVEWDGDDLACPTPASTEAIELDAGSVMVKAWLYSGDDDVPSACDTELVYVDGDVSVSLTLGACD